MLTKDQAIHSELFHCFNPHRKRCETWRRNGKTKTWITRPEHWRIPLKHGLYDYGNLDDGQANVKDVDWHVASECPYYADL